MRAVKIRSKKLFVIITTIALIFGCVFIFIPDSIQSAEAAVSSKVTERLSGTLYGQIIKQSDGSVIFRDSDNPNNPDIEIATKEENLQDMYVFIQAPGGDGYGRHGGGSGGFCAVLIHFRVRGTNADGSNNYIPITVDGKHDPSGLSVINYNNVLVFIACVAGGTYPTKEDDEEYDYAWGGPVMEAISNNYYAEIIYKRDGRNGGRSRSILLPGGDSTSFSVTMKKNGLITSRFFGHKSGGLTPPLDNLDVKSATGGGASPYAKGGNGAYQSYLIQSNYSQAQDGAYGSGGGGAIETPWSNCTVPGKGGAGLLEIWG